MAGDRNISQLQPLGRSFNNNDLLILRGFLENRDFKVTYAQLAAAFAGIFSADVIAALAGNGGSPSDANKYVTEQGLNNILTALELSTGRRIISADVVVTSATAGTITTEWLNNAGIERTLTDEAITFAGAPTAGNLRWDLVELFDDGTVAVLTGTAGATAVRPTPTANTLTAWEGIWNESGSVQPIPETSTSPWSALRYSTQLAPDTTGKFAKIWQGNISRDNNYAIIIAYNDPKNGVNFDGTGTGLLKVSFTVDTNRNIVANTVKILTDQDSMAGEFRLVQIAGNQAAIYHKGSHFWSRIDFRVLFNSHAVQLVDFVDQGVYGAAPSAVATYDSQQQGVLEYFSSTGPVLFDAPMGRPRSYGDDTPVTGNITFGTTGAITTVMPKMRHNDTVEPTFTPPGGVALIKEGGTYEVNVDNYILAICEKNTSGAVVRIRYTISKNEA